MQMAFNHLDPTQPFSDSVDSDPMLIDHRLMKLVWLGTLLAMLGCTRPNPRSCSDGLCTDQRYPFCDVDGSLEGTPQTCISVSCNPGEFAACRGDL